MRVSTSNRATAVSTKILSVRVVLAKPSLSEPGFTGLSDFQDYSHQGFLQKLGHVLIAVDRERI